MQCEILSAKRQWLPFIILALCAMLVFECGAIVGSWFERSQNDERAWQPPLTCTGDDHLIYDGVSWSCGYISSIGYLNGTTRFRDLEIQDGIGFGNSISTVDGTATYVVSGNITLGD